MKRLLFLFLILVHGAVFAQAPAQAPSRIRGTITEMVGNVMHVKTRDGRDVQVSLAAETAVAIAQNTTLTALKDKYVGVTLRRAKRLQNHSRQCTLSSRV